MKKNELRLDQQLNIRSIDADMKTDRQSSAVCFVFDTSCLRCYSLQKRFIEASLTRNSYKALISRRPTPIRSLL
nr:hypothetical protein BCU54_17715 [Vibrio lentus]